MTNLIRRAGAALAVMLLVFTGFSFATSAPASASLGSCPNGNVCFWDWINFNDASTHYFVHIQNAYGPACVTLPANMRDKATSMAFNNTSAGGAGHIRFFNWINCNPAGNYATLSDTFTPQPNLNCPTWMSPCNDYYNDNFNSFDWIPN